jgi:RNA polymerase sigma factor (sigma-70 family)
MQQQEPVMLTDLSCDALYQHYASGILAYFYKQTASRDDAEDLLLDVFLAAMERNNLAGLKEAEQKAWLWGVARNKVADYYRRKARHPGVKLKQVEETLYVDEAQEPEQITLRREEYADLRATVAQLTELQQDVLQLRFAYGFSCAEIATVLEKKEGAVRMVLSRTLKFLRSIYDRRR